MRRKEKKERQLEEKRREQEEKGAGVRGDIKDCPESINRPYPKAANPNAGLLSHGNHL